jgi:alkylated DNA repair protein (DNA oxidative demethylase)
MIAADLFDESLPAPVKIQEGMFLLRRFADAAALLPLVERIAEISPFRHLVMPRGGRPLSVAMTNCGEVGWLSDRTGYHYEPIDPKTREPWPGMPASFANLARRAAAFAGFMDFSPDCCLINRYAVGSRLGAHQDRDEADFTQPIVSVSIGMPAVFFTYEGETRIGRSRSVPVRSGDVVVWGSPARLAYHGVREIKPGYDALTGELRYNLTFRRAR